jgi:hypothetical protein
MKDITHLATEKDFVHRCKSMVVEITFISVECGVATSYHDCLEIVRRTPWGRALPIQACSEAILNSGVLALLTEKI